MSIPISQFIPPHLPAFYFFKDCSHPNSLKWDFTVVLICSSLMDNDIEHLFMGLLAVLYLLWKNVYSNTLPNFNCCCYCFLNCWVVKAVYIFWIILDNDCLLDMWFANISSILFSVLILEHPPCESIHSLWLLPLYLLPLSVQYNTQLYRLQAPWICITKLALKLWNHG